jgi:hypothetical protein
MTAERDAPGGQFNRHGEVFLPSFYTQGPWDPGSQFGGAPAALLATLVEEIPTLVPMQIARFSIDLLRPVPLTPLTPQLAVVREGKRIQVVAFSLLADELEVARGSALRVRTGDLGDIDLPDGRRPNPLPEHPHPASHDPFSSPPHGARLAVEYHFEKTGGYFFDPTWARLHSPVISGEPITPIGRLAYCADMASGIGHRNEAGLRGINADLSLNVVRYPEGEWLCLKGRGWTSRSGIGQVQGTMYDTAGVTATVSMARLVDPSDGVTATRPAINRLSGGYDERLM